MNRSGFYCSSGTYPKYPVHFAFLNPVVKRGFLFLDLFGFFGMLGHFRLAQRRKVVSRVPFVTLVALILGQLSQMFRKDMCSRETKSHLISVFCLPGLLFSHRGICPKNFRWRWSLCWRLNQMAGSIFAYRSNGLVILKQLAYHKLYWFVLYSMWLFVTVICCNYIHADIIFIHFTPRSALNALSAYLRPIHTIIEYFCCDQIPPNNHN